MVPSQLCDPGHVIRTAGLKSKVRLLVSCLHSAGGRMNERPTREPLLRPRRPPPSLRVPLPQTKLLPWPRPPIPARLALARTGSAGRQRPQACKRARAPGHLEPRKPTPQRGAHRSASVGSEGPCAPSAKGTKNQRARWGRSPPPRGPPGLHAAVRIPRSPRPLAPRHRRLRTLGLPAHAQARRGPTARPRLAPLTCQAHTIHPRSFPGALLRDPSPSPRSSHS